MSSSRESFFEPAPMWSVSFVRSESVGLVPNSEKECRRRKRGFVSFNSRNVFLTIPLGCLSSAVTILKYTNYTKYTKYTKYINIKIPKLQHLQKNITKITKYELWNLYIIQNKTCVFEFYYVWGGEFKKCSRSFQTFPKFSKKSKVYWHCWPIL